MKSGNKKSRKIKLEEMDGIALDILKSINQNSSMADVIALSGELGAGKTTLSQTIGKNLGVKENMISPTFVIMKNYELPAGKKEYKWEKLIHIDAYRLDSSTELLNLGWEELIKDNKNLIIIEWPERVPTCIPENAHKIILEHKSDGIRQITF